MDNKLIKTAIVVGLIAILTLLLFLTLEVSSLRKQVNDYSKNIVPPSDVSLSVNSKN